MKVRFSVLLVIISFAFAEENAPLCITPNGENATCISIYSCKPIKEALTNFDEKAVRFARDSQCGPDDTIPMVCCGSVGGRVTLPPDQTVAPTLPTPSIGAPSVPVPISNLFLPDSSLCGLQLHKESRIVGGRDTEINEFPWLVALKYKKDDGSPGGVRCSGTLINHRYILTAAQCLSIPGYNLHEVRLGEWRLSTEKDCSEDTVDHDFCADPVVDLVIQQITPHPYYNKKSGNNDIALLQVGEKINYTDYIRPICLPQEDFPPPLAGTRMDITGWGITEKGIQSDVKLKVKIPMVGNPECAKAYPNFARINPNQACAGGEAGKDACNGDSGGPLMRIYEKEDKTDDVQWFQEGIIYRGLGCGLKGVPGLYTRVSRYIKWILNNLKSA